MKYLTTEELQNSLLIEDLTEKNGHSINLIANQIIIKLSEYYKMHIDTIRGSRVVNAEDNYDFLYYPKDTITKSEVYTRWITSNTLLRTQMTACVPNTLKFIANNKQAILNHLLVFPGIVFRRDVIDRTHVGEPHQMDVWKVSKSKKYERKDLLELVNVILECILPNCKWRYNETTHFYTKDGIEVEVYINGQWLEILECGLALPKLLDDCGLDSNEWSGLALGMGLDRCIMIKKEIKDIRILRSKNPKIEIQLYNLEKYKEISAHPQISRDLSIAIDKNIDNEILGDKIRYIVGEFEKDIESVNITSETRYEDLPEHVRKRLGMNNLMKNILLRIIIRPLDRSLTRQQANEIYTLVYSKLHEGSVGYTIDSIDK